MLQPPTWLLLSNTIPCAFCFPRSLLMPANYSLKFPSLLSAQFLGPASPLLPVSNRVADKAAGSFLQGPGSETCPGNPSPDPYECRDKSPLPAAIPAFQQPALARQATRISVHVSLCLSSHCCYQVRSGKPQPPTDLLCFSSRGP